MKEHKIIKKLMGSVFELIIQHEDNDFAEKWLQKGVCEIERLEKDLTEFSEDSYTSMINQNAGVKPVRVSTETYALIERCIRLSELTQGAFDITVSPLKSIYNFKNKEFKFPSQSRIKSALQKTGYRNILLNGPDNVMLAKSGMKISFAAVGKGFAADKVKQLWVEAGIADGIVNASGDLTVLGTNNKGDDWKVGIPNPENTKEVLFHLPVRDASVATSGNYEQFFTYKDRKYSHNIHPKTGMPLTDIKSVTVVSPGAELSDALATALSVMGNKAGLHLIDQLPQTYAIVINDKDEVFHSKQIQLLYDYV